MAKDVEFVLDKQGVHELLNCKELMDGMQQIGDEVASRAGEGYAADTRPGKVRAHTFIKAITSHAYFSNLKHNTLLKAIQR